MGGSVSPWGQGHWQQKFWEVHLGVSPPRVCHYLHQRAQVGSSVGLPQAKQKTGREPSPTHQQSSGLKFYWALTTTATVSSTHQQSLPSSLLDSLIHQRADSRGKKNYNPAACGIKITFTERYTRWKGRGLYTRWRNKKKPRKTTKWSGDRRPSRKRIQNNDSEDDPGPQNKNGGKDREDARNV